MSRKKVVKLKKREQKEFKEVKPVNIKQVEPSYKYIVKFSDKDTKYLVLLTTTDVILMLSLDGAFNTVTLPRKIFENGKITFNDREVLIKVFKEEV